MSSTAERNAQIDATRQPHRESAPVVVAAQDVRAAAGFVHGGAPELSAPHHDGAVSSPLSSGSLTSAVAARIHLAAEAGFQLVDDVFVIARAVGIPAAMV